MRSWFQSIILVTTNPRLVEAVTTGLALSPWALILRQLIEKYLFADWAFLGFLMVLIFVDTVSGVFRSWAKRQISSRAFSRVFTKVFIYMALLVLAHVMTSFTVHGEKNVVFQWFDTFIYCSMMAREALSVLENLGGIDDKLIPQALVKRLALFSQDPEAAQRELATPTPTVEAAPTIPSLDPQIVLPPLPVSPHVSSL